MIVAHSRNPKNSADNKIKGKGRVIHWPRVIHLCLQRPMCIPEEALVNGMQISDAHYRIKGLVHHRDDGEWTVSLNKTGLGWHHLTNDSVQQQQRDTTSNVVLVQLCRENQDDSTNIAGL